MDKPGGKPEGGEVKKAESGEGKKPEVPASAPHK